MGEKKRDRHKKKTELVAGTTKSLINFKEYHLYEYLCDFFSSQQTATQIHVR
jgi:hypothetical protein